MKKRIIAGIFGSIFGIFFDRIWMKKIVKKYEEKLMDIDNVREKYEINANRYKDKWEILVKWRYISNENIKKFFITHKYKNIAIYGFGELGEFLAEEIIEAKDVNLKCIIDYQKWGTYYKNIPIINLENSLEDIDCIVISTVRNFEEVKEQIEKKKEIKIISINELIEGAQQKKE